MFVIRTAQLEALRQAAIRQYEDDLVAHIRRFTPAHAASLGEPRLRPIIRQGIDRAGGYGLTNAGPARFFVECLFLFGGDFDSDPQLPWAGRTLTDPSIPDQSVRADQLYAHARHFIDVVAGPDNRYEKAALTRAAAVGLGHLPEAGPQFEEEIIRGLRRLHPEKCAYVGEAPLRSLIARAAGLARRHALEPDRGTALLVGLMFTFGHGCVDDPQYPWIGAALAPEPAPDRARRAARLFGKLSAYVSAALSSTERA
jgi:hypothetical protein